MRVTELWRTRVAGDLDSLAFGVHVNDDVALVHWRSAGGTRLVALAEDGRTAWTYDRQQSTNLALVRGRAYLGGPSALVLDAASGAKLAERDFGSPVRLQAQTSDSGPVCWVTDRRKLAGVRPDDLSTIWEWDRGVGVHRSFLYRCSRDEVTTIALADLVARTVTGPFGDLAGYHTFLGNLYCVVGRRGGGRIAVDVLSGEVAWRGDEPVSMPAVGFGPTTAYSVDRAVHAWDLRTGALLWHRHLSAAAASLPVEADGVVSVITADNVLHVLDAGSGAVVASHTLEVAARRISLLRWRQDRLLISTSRELVCVELDPRAAAPALDVPSVVRVLEGPKPATATPSAATAVQSNPNLTDFLVFGGLFLISVAQPFLHGLSWRVSWRAAVLALIAFYGFAGSDRRLWRAVGILSFLIGWFLSPLAGMIAIFGSAIFRPRRPAAPRV